MTRHRKTVYHLSDKNIPYPDESGTFEVSPAHGVFDSWIKGKIYLHKVVYHTDDMVRFTPSSIFNQLDMGTPTLMHVTPVNDLFCPAITVHVKKIIPLKCWNITQENEFMDLMDNHGFINKQLWGDDGSFEIAIIGSSEIGSDGTHPIYNLYSKFKSPEYSPKNNHNRGVKYKRPGFVTRLVSRIRYSYKTRWSQ